MNSQTSTIHLAQALAKSFRPRTAVFSWSIYAVVVITHKGIDVLSIALGLVLFVTMYGIVALQNDLSDIETDKINHRKDIPYSNGQLTETQLIKTLFILSVVATIVGIFLNYYVLLWVGLYLVLGYIYSGPPNVKSQGVFAALLLGFCYGAIPWLIAASVTGQLHEINLIILASISFIFSSGIIVLKDFRDIKGDKATGKNTLLVAKGAEWTRRYYVLVTCLAYVLLLTYLYVLGQNGVFLLLGIFIGLLNYWLLVEKSITTKANIRSKRGRWARVLFFGYALTAYFVMVNII